MSYGYDDLPAITNHRLAAVRYDAIKPLRGSNPPIRPLGKRARKDVRISRDDVSDTYYVEYANALKITYYPDNTIDLAGKFRWQSVRAIAVKVLNREITVLHGRKWIKCATLPPDRVEPMETWLELKDNLTGYKAMPDELPPYRLYQPNPVYPQSRRLDKVRAKQAREPVQHFWKYCTGLLKLYGEDYVPAELAIEAFGSRAGKSPASAPWSRVSTPPVMVHADRFEYMTSGDYEQYNHLFLCIAFECRDGSFPRWMNGAFVKFYPVTSALAAFKRRIEATVYALNPDVYGVKTVMNGKIPTHPA